MLGNKLAFEKLKEISKRIQGLIRQGRYEEALELCTNEICEQDEAILSQKITILFKLERYEEIVVECDKGYNRWKKNRFIKSKLIATSHIIQKLIRQGRYGEALELCTNEICEQDEAILGQKIDILLKLEKYEEALELCTDEICEQDEVIQRQKITILFKLERYEEIVVECDKGYNRWKNEGFIKSKLYAISHILQKLILQGRYKEALELCTDEICEQDEVILGQKKHIENLLSVRNKNILNSVDSEIENEKIYYTEEMKTEVNKMLLENEEQEINLYLTRIYFGDISKEEIQDLADSFMKTILQVAYFEKSNKCLGIKFIKQAILNKNLTDKEKKILNILKERLLSKKNIVFDLGLYCKILNCNIDYHYEKKEKNPDSKITERNHIKGRTSSNQEKMPIKNNNSKIIVQEGKRIKRHANNTKKANLDSQNDLIEQDVLLKDLFSNEVLEIQKYVFMQMHSSDNQRKVINAWDNFACLIYKNVKDKMAYNRMLEIIRKCADAHVLDKDKVTRKIIKGFLKEEKYTEAIKECNRFSNKKDCLIELKAIAFLIKERLRAQTIVVDDNEKVLKLCEKIINL